MKKLIAILVLMLLSVTYAVAGNFSGQVRQVHRNVTTFPVKPIMLENAYDSIGGSVSRAALTRAVVNREPVDNITEETDLKHIYFFTELKGFMGEKVFHRWVFNGEVVKETEFEVGGPRWRVWSSATLVPNLLGEWKVYVVDITGRVIREAIFDYVPFLEH